MEKKNTTFYFLFLISSQNFYLSLQVPIRVDRAHSALVCSKVLELKQEVFKFLNVIDLDDAMDLLHENTGVVLFLAFSRSCLYGHSMKLFQHRDYFTLLFSFAYVSLSRFENINIPLKYPQFLISYPLNLCTKFRRVLIRDFPKISIENVWSNFSK